MGEELDATTKSLIITTLITSSLSVLTTMIFFFFYFKFAPIRNNKASQLFLMLATSNLIIWTVTMVNSLNLLVKNETNSTYNASTCAAIGYILHLSGLMGIMSVLLITLLFYICVLSNDYWATKVNHIIIITILTTVGVSVVPFIYKGFGPDGKVMCWIGNVEIKFWGLYFYVIILAFLIIYFVLVCLKTIRKLKISDNEKIRLTRHVVVFPIILFVSALPGMILTFLEVDLIFAFIFFISFLLD